MVARPGAEQLARPARKVEHDAAGSQLQRVAQGGEFRWGEELWMR